MKKLTGSQLALLRLILANPGPSIEEMYQFAPLYGVSRESLRTDYIVLLKELLVSPLSSIDRKYYLPNFCLITEKGKVVIREVLEKEPERIPRRKVSIFKALEEALELDEVAKDWPSFDECSDEEIELLANVYLYWAKKPYAQRPLISSDELFWAAAKGFAKLNKIELFSESLTGCFMDLKENRRWEYLFGMIFYALKKYPNLEDVILESASKALTELYLHLMGKMPSKHLTKEDIIELVRKFIDQKFML